jgi:ubiquinone/menaquinone biosynthesis C-methylase UbiE
MDQASFPELYERWLVGPLFRPWAETALSEVRLSAGDRVLDIACGTGIAARVASERLGGAARVAGVDLNPEMLAVARRLAPGIDWRQGDAAALPLHDGERFDVVICLQGLQFFPDRPAAAAEMRRALAEGGRLAVATWRPDDDIPFFRELRGIAERHLGPVADRRHGFGEAAPLEALLRDAGLREVRSRTLSRIVRFAEGAPLLRLNAMALVGMSPARTMDDEQRRRVVEAIVGDSAPVLARYADGAGLAFELRTNLATARS